MYIVACYTAYLVISLSVTIWVAQTLQKSGRPFLIDAFHGNGELADSVNRLLVVGFYLINLGYISLQLKLESAPDSAAGVVEALAGKLGLVLLVLGVMHFGNLGVLAKLRQNTRLSRGQDASCDSPPPIAPPPSYAVQPPAVG